MAATCERCGKPIESMKESGSQAMQVAAQQGAGQLAQVIAAGVLAVFGCGGAPVTGGFSCVLAVGVVGAILWLIGAMQESSPRCGDCSR